MILFSRISLRPRYLLLEAEKLWNIHDKGKQHESAGDEQQDQDGLLGKLREGDDCEHDGVEDDGVELSEPLGARKRAVLRLFIEESARYEHGELLEDKQYKNEEEVGMTERQIDADRRLCELVGERIEQLAERCDQTETARDDPVSDIGHAREKQYRR